jgi:membrane-associated phospholipid phosphatase
MPLLTSSERLQLNLIMIVVVLDAVLLTRGPMTLTAVDALKPLLVSVAATGAGIYYRHKRDEERLAVALIGTSHLIAFSTAIAILNYLVVAFDRPLIDTTLLAWDQALGIHWPDVFNALKTTPYLQSVLTAAYASSLLQIAVVVPVLALLGKVECLDRFFLAFILAASVTVGFWAAFPSFGAATYLFSVGAITDLSNAAVDRRYVETLLALKNGEIRNIVLADMKGLIAFPSFHTVMAVLTVYAAAAVPRALGPALAWNAVVLLSVPVDGGHHVVDIVAGIVVAIAALAAADRICQWRGNQSTAALVQAVTTPA